MLQCHRSNVKKRSWLFRVYEAMKCFPVRLGWIRPDQDLRMNIQEQLPDLAFVS